MENNYDVFISYSSKDQKIAEGICGYLESRKYRCFVAYRDIPKGKIWAAIIPSAIHASRMMVVVFSDSFNLSNQTDRELELAAEDKIPILTFRINDTVFTGAKEYYLKNLNWIDAFPEPEKCFGQIYDSVSRLAPKSEDPYGDIDDNEEGKSEKANVPHYLKVKIDIDCIFYIDGEEKAFLNSGKIEKISLPQGEFELKFVSTENPAVVIEQEVEMPNFDKLLKISLKDLWPEQYNSNTGNDSEAVREHVNEVNKTAKEKEIIETKRPETEDPCPEDSHKSMERSLNDKIKLWMSSKRINAITLEGHKDTVNMTSFSSDGRLLASASDDKTIRIWHVPTGELLNTFNHRCPIRQVGFSPDDKYVYGLEAMAYYKKRFGIKYLTSNDEKILYLWDIKKEKTIIELEHIESISFGGKGESFITNSGFCDLPSGEIGVIDIRNMNEGKIVKRFFTDETIENIKWSIDNSKILSYGGSTLSVYGVNGKLLFSKDVTDVADASFNRDSDRILVLGDSACHIGKGVRVLNGTNGKELYDVEKSRSVWHACFSHDRSFIAGTIDDDDERGHLLGFWNPNNGKLIHVWAHIGDVEHIALSQDDTIIAASMFDNTIKLIKAY